MVLPLPPSLIEPLWGNYTKKGQLGQLVLTLVLTSFLLLSLAKNPSDLKEHGEKPDARHFFSSEGYVEAHFALSRTEPSMRIRPVLIVSV
jgi:hypothetical protein